MNAPWDFVGLIVWAVLMPYLLGIVAFAVAVAGVGTYYGLRRLALGMMSNRFERQPSTYRRTD